jgi:phosphoglycolate phosphatase
LTVRVKIAAILVLGAVMKAILFDLDGTLVDTAPDLAAAANHVRALNSLPPLPLSDYRRSASAGAGGMLKVATGSTPQDGNNAEQRQQFLAYYREHLAVGSGLFDGIPALLAGLEARGLVWGIVTNKPSRFTTPLLQALSGLEGAGSVVSGDSTPHPKPAPDALLLAAEQLGIRPQDCYYLGDDKRDIDAAKAAGMRSFACAWGYEGEHPLPSWGADVVLAQPLELLAYV